MEIKKLEYDFSLIGILSEISGILADNKIGIFAVSTYNTDKGLSNKCFVMSVCVKCSMPIPLDSSNSVEKLCDSWVLSTSVCGAGSFSTHTVTHSISESAHETQSVSAKLRKPKKSKVDNLPL